METSAMIILVILVAIVVFFITRELWCWYWKINEIREGNIYRGPDSEHFRELYNSKNFTSCQIDDYSIFINGKGELEPKIFKELIQEYIKKYSPHDFFGLYENKKGKNLIRNIYQWFDNTFYEKEIEITKNFSDTYWKDFQDDDSCYIAYEEKSKDDFDSFTLNIETNVNIDKETVCVNFDKSSEETFDNEFEVYGDSKSDELFIKNFNQIDRIYLIDKNGKHIKNMKKFYYLDFPESMKNIVLSVKLDDEE